MTFAALIFLKLGMPCSIFHFKHFSWKSQSILITIELSATNYFLFYFYNLTSKKGIAILKESRCCSSLPRNTMLKLRCSIQTFLCEVRARLGRWLNCIRVWRECKSAKSANLSQEFCPWLNLDLTVYNVMRYLYILIPCSVYWERCIEIRKYN